MKDKLDQATREKEIAKIDVDEKIKEQEAVKMIRFKVGFNKVVVGYLDLAEKVSKNDISYKNLSKYRSFGEYSSFDFVFKIFHLLFKTE